MTLDEAIDGLKRIFSNYELNLPCTDSLNIETEIIVLLEELKSSRQELNELRKYSYVQGHSDGYINAIDDFVKVVKKHDWNIRNRNENEFIYGAIDRLAEQLKVGDKNVNNE